MTTPRSTTSSVFYNTTVPMVPTVVEDKIQPGVTLDTDLSFLIPEARPCDTNPRLIKIDQSLPLSVAVEEYAKAWHLSDPEAFAFLIGPDCLAAGHRLRFFLTEEHLELRYKLEVKTANAIVDALGNDEVSKLRTALQLIKTRSADPTFSSALLSQNALQHITGMIENKTCLGQNDVPQLLLGAMVGLMECPLREGETAGGRWEAVSPALLSQLSETVTGATKVESSDLVTAALNVLELILTNSPTHYAQIKEEVKFAALIRHLDHSSQEIQRNTLALMNALYRSAEDAERDDISEQVRGKPVRNAILHNIIKGRSGAELGSELSHQLGVLQRLLFNTHYAPLLCRPFSTASDSADLQLLNGLRSALFQPLPALAGAPLSPSSAHKATHAHMAGNYEALGFPHPENPAADLVPAPPGVLPLVAMVHFVSECRDDTNRIILDRSSSIQPGTAKSSQSLPFALVAIRLTSLLADLLHITKPPLEAGHPFMQMFFESEAPFEQIFCVAMNILRKNWRDMSATIADIEKVMRVVGVQLQRGLSAGGRSVEAFGEELSRWPYCEVKRLWDEERAKEEERAAAKVPIQELRADLRTELLPLVSANRLNVLRRGSCFPKYATGDERSVREKGKWTWWALDPAGTCLLHQETSVERSPPPIGTLEDSALRLPVSELRGVLSGAACPHVRDGKRAKALDPAAAFTLLTADEDAGHNFLAPDAKTAMLWMDGFNALLGQEPDSQLAQEEMNILLDMELKIRLLALEGLHIPAQNPHIPPLPNNLPSQA